MIEVGSDFSGVGAFEQALIRLGLKYRTIFACEMDIWARETYMANYGEPYYYPFDVYDRKIPKQSLDIYMTSPPCQAFSLAGKRQGENDDRGVLFYNSHEFIIKNKPRYFIFENVKGLLSDAKGRTFQIWLDMLGGKSVNGNPVIFPREDAAPYHIYYQVLNAKDYGVPQNRERVFIVGIRDDIDNNFHWPKPFHLVKRLKDVLEYNVDEKYFLSQTMLNYFEKHKNEQNEIGNGFKFEPHTNETKYSNTISTKCGNRQTDPYIKVKTNKILKLGNTNPSGNGMNGNVFDTTGISPTLSTNKGEGIKVKSANSKGYEIAIINDTINLSQLNSETRRGRVGKGVANTLDIACNQAVVIGAFRYQDYKIRRLTPRECFRLMDFPDSFIMPCSNSQMYKQAGNSIVVNVLSEIIKKLL